MSADLPGGIKTRRALSRALSRAANADVAQALALAAREPTQRAWRIGVTGPPGAGKSSLIARLGQARLEHMGQRNDETRPGECLAIIAIDPASPVSGGALLGDRVRMDAIAADPRVFVRSLSSRSGTEGLTHNIVDVLSIADEYGFEDVILETVGAGQSDHAARKLVDSLVLVLHPDSGDSIQAMKSGIMELADIYVVNKADLANAARTAAELRAVIKVAHRVDRDWVPPVIEIDQGRPEGIAALDDALETHRRHLATTSDQASAQRVRRAYQLQSLLMRRIGEIIGGNPDVLDASAKDGFRKVVEMLNADLLEEKASTKSSKITGQR